MLLPTVHFLENRKENEITAIWLGRGFLNYFEQSQSSDFHLLRLYWVEFVLEHNLIDNFAEFLAEMDFLQFCLS